MPTYRSAVRTARAVSGPGARTSTAVPSQVAPVVGRQRPVGDQLVSARRHGKVGGRLRAEAKYQIPATTIPAAGKVPHGAP
jgi:hypothetical protein